MTNLEVHLGGDELAVVIDSGADSPARHHLPAGTARLLADVLLGDPPLPEELTNAIGWVVDHLDDLVLERPDLLGTATIVTGVGAVAVAAVEVGGDPPLPFVLTRPAAEDVFRTVVTEPAGDRRLNPGLPADLVHEVVAAACVIVGVMRRLHLDDVTICTRTDQAAPITETSRPAP